jgi:hypothetical protein
MPLDRSDWRYRPVWWHPLLLDPTFWLPQPPSKLVHTMVMTAPVEHLLDQERVVFRTAGACDGHPPSFPQGARWSNRSSAKRSARLAAECQLEHQQKENKLWPSASRIERPGARWRDLRSADAILIRNDLRPVVARTPERMTQPLDGRELTLIDQFRLLARFEVLVHSPTSILQMSVLLLGLYRAALWSENLASQLKEVHEGQ